MIHIENLKKYYGRLPAIDGITLDVAKGDILGFLGPNGAGKTTTMKVITSYYPPTGGKVTVDGLDVTERSLETRQMIGYLPENNPLYHDLTVFEYLRYIADLRQIAKGDQTKRIGRMLDIAGLNDRANQAIGQLSKGYRQRVGLAQAMIHDPKILILDEPTIGLDPNQIVEIRLLIKEIGREKTVILSTHILPEVQATCNRVAIIHKGKIVADGTPNELQQRFEGQPVIELKVHGDGADNLSTFQKVHGVDKVERLTDPEPNVVCLRLVTVSGTDPRAEIFRLCIKQKWTLLGMNREIRSLENIFRQLTHDDLEEAQEEAA